MQPYTTALIGHQKETQQQAALKNTKQSEFKKFKEANKDVDDYLLYKQFKEVWKKKEEQRHDEQLWRPFE